MSEKLKILHLEDDARDVELVRAILNEQDYEYELDIVDTRDGFISALNEGRYNLVISDYSLPTYDGWSALREHQQKCPDVPFIMFTGSLGEERAVDTLKMGATDYVAKENFDRLGPAISRSLKEVSEQKKRRAAEQKLQDAYERFYHLVNSSPSVIYSTTYGEKHDCSFMSDNLLKMYGYPPSKMTGNSKFWLSCMHPDDRMKTTKLIERQLQNGDTGLVEYRFKNSDGEYCWISDSFKVLYDLKNEPSEIVGAWTDVTAYKDAVEETKRLTTAINVADDSIFITDANATILYINPAFSQLTGYSYEDAIGNNPRIISSSHHSKEFWQNFWDTIKKGGVFKEVLVNQTKAGDEYYSEQTVTPICDESGTVIEYVSVMRDITKRILAEEEREKLLHDKGERIKEIQCLYGVVECIQNRTTLKEIFQDVAELIPLGWRYPEITRGKVTFDGEEYVSEPFEETEWAQSSDIMVNGESRGSIAVYYLEECLELDEGPFLTEERDLIYGMSRAISEAIERKLTEEQLRRSQKMEAIGQLAGGVAHDFNNLLSIIQGNFELLGDYDVKDEKFQQRIDTGLKTVQRGSSLTRRLLSFSRDDIVEEETTNINVLIVELKELIEKSLTPKIEVTINLGKDVWDVTMNTNEFQDALVNLAINARDAMPDGGVLSISTVNKVMDEDNIQTYPGLKVGRYVCMCVSDTGCGMDEAMLEKVFEPFFTTKEKEKGTGLGLSMVYGFAKRSQGDVKFYSEVGHGTTVRLYLPVVERAAEASVENDTGKDTLPNGTETLLVVDDESDILNVTKQQIESLGYRVLTASNCIEALDVINNDKGQIDLLLSDVMMPGGMNGYELAEEVEKRDLDIKILLASGFTDNIPKKTDTSNFHFEVMEKPYTKTELANKVRDLLDSG